MVNMPAAYQDDGKLLAEGKRNEDMLTRADELRKPCFNLRELVIAAPLDHLAQPKNATPRVPYPLAGAGQPVEFTFDDAQHMEYRYTANLLNEAIHQQDEAVHTVLLWYRNVGTKSIETLDKETRAAMEYNLPQVEKVTTEYNCSPEDMPKVLQSSEDQPVTERYIVDLKLLRPPIHNLMATSMTPHTTMMLFIKRKREHYVFMGYTVPKTTPSGKRAEDKLEEGQTEEAEKADDEADVTAEAAADAKAQREKEVKTSGRIELRLRLSTTAYVADADFTSLAPRSLTYENLCGLLSPYALQQSLIRVARTDGFIMTEDAFGLLQNLPTLQRRALGRPRLSVFTLSAGDHLDHDHFETIVEPFLTERLAPQQLRFCHHFLYMLVLRVLTKQDDRYNLLPLGGPPGTGKTGTIVKAILLARTPDVIRQVVQAIGAKRGHDLANLDDIVEECLAHPIAYVAPTNDACDEAVSQASSEKGHMLVKQPDADIRCDPVRLCSIDMAQKKPEQIHLHVLHSAAKRHKENKQAALARAEREFARLPRPRNGQLIKRDRKKKQEALEGLVNDPVQAAALQREIEELDEEREQSKLLMPGWERANDTIYDIRQRHNNSVKQIDEFIQAPEQYGKAVFGKRKERNLALEQHYKRVIPKIVANPRTVCFMTAGFANPYQKHAQGALVGALVVADEYGQLGFADELRVMSTSSDLVVCGDMHQLGATIMGHESGTCDIRHSLLKKLKAETIWLTLCFRLHPISTSFHNTGAYAQTGLYSPTGQNVIRSSPLHRRALFGPMVLLNVDAESERLESGSRFNEHEAHAVYQFLAEFVRAAVGNPPIKLRVMSPYRAQRDLLREKCAVFASSPCFSEVHFGTVETSQGSTTDLAICSLAGTTSTDFLTNERLTVASSRHRQHFVLVANVSKLLTLDPDSMLYRLIAPSDLVHRIRMGSDKKSITDACREAARCVQPTVLPALTALSACEAPAAADPWLNKGESAAVDIGSVVQERMASFAILP